MANPRQMVLLMSKNSSSDAKDSILRQGDLKVVKLPHPKGSIPVMFLQSGDNEIYELQNAAPRKHGSWFINQRVSSDPSFYLATRIDPRFLVLTYLEKVGTRYSPLDQIVTVAEGCARFNLDKAASWKLEEMCDVNDKFGDDMILYRHNEAKTLEWLKAKVYRAARALLSQKLTRDKTELLASNFNISAQSSSSSAPMPPAAAEIADEAIDREEVRVALQIVCDYVSEDLTNKLLQLFGFKSADLAPTKAQNAVLKRKADWEQELELEKETLAYSMKPVQPASSTSSLPSAPAKKKPATSASKLGKPVEAAKSIASFFGAKK